jgi:hypothetical protein
MAFIVNHLQGAGVTNTYEKMTDTKVSGGTSRTVSGKGAKPLLSNLHPDRPPAETAINIELGSICIQIQCKDREINEKMLADYRPFLVSREPDFRIVLNLRDSLSKLEVKKLLTVSNLRTDGDWFAVTLGLLEMRVDWSQAALSVDTEKAVFAPGMDYKLLNYLMLGIYSGIYTKIKNATPDAYLVHGCGIIDGRHCYLFTGPSGSGKTTVARLAHGRRVLNDEAVLIGKNKERIIISGTPFEGGQAEKCNTSAHLSAIFFLKHDVQVSLRKLTKVETYIRLLSQIFATSPLFEIPGDDCLRRRAELSADMATAVPSYELAFRPDSSFWDVIKEI